MCSLSTLPDSPCVEGIITSPCGECDSGWVCYLGFCHIACTRDSSCAANQVSICLSTLYVSTLSVSTLYVSTLSLLCLYSVCLYSVSTLYTLLRMSLLYILYSVYSTLSLLCIYSVCLYSVYSTLYVSTLYVSTLYTLLCMSLLCLYSICLYSVSTLYVSTLYTLLSLLCMFFYNCVSYLLFRCVMVVSAYATIPVPSVLDPVKSQVGVFTNKSHSIQFSIHITHTAYNIIL